MNSSLGILGVGHLATYVIAGLRRAGDQREILLSPRNAQRAQALVREHRCVQERSNQTVVERARIILLSVRPHQLESLLEPLEFKADHLLISCVAGVSLEHLRSLVGDAQVVRTLPLACAEVGEGAVPLYPEHPEARALLSQLGELVLLGSEAQFELASVAACMNGWMFKFFAQLTEWYAAQGLAPETAKALVLHAFSGAVALADASTDKSMVEISDSIATEGTYTKLGLDMLESQGAFDLWVDACAEVEKALKS